MYEIYISLYSYNNGNIQETLQQLKDLRDLIGDKSNKAYKKIDNFIDEKIHNLNLCPQCYNELSTKVVNCDRVEVWGRPDKIEEYQSYCSNCGWEEI
jgi:flagellar biosynthesis chaperone FliJ